MISSEEIFSALFSLLKGADQFKTFTRRAVVYKNLTAESMPGLFLQQYRMKTIGDNPEMPQTMVWQARILGCLFDGGQQEEIMPNINSLVDNVLDALAPDGDDGVRQTLGGIVYQCRIDGECFFAEAFSGESEFILPVQITVPYFRGA